MFSTSIDIGHRYRGCQAQGTADRHVYNLSLNTYQPTMLLFPSDRYFASSMACSSTSLQSTECSIQQRQSSSVCLACKTTAGCTASIVSHVCVSEAHRHMTSHCRESCSAGAAAIACGCSSVLHTSCFTSAGTRLSTSTTFCTSCMACCIVMSYKKRNNRRACKKPTHNCHASTSMSAPDLNLGAHLHNGRVRILKLQCTLTFQSALLPGRCCLGCFHNWRHLCLCL